MERQDGPPPIGVVRKIFLVSGVFLFVSLSVLVFIVYPSRDNDFWFLGLNYIIWTPMIVGWGRQGANRIFRWWLHVVPGGAVGLGLFLYLIEAFELQPTASSIIVSISGVVITILARLASTRITRGFLLANNIFQAGALVSFLFPALYFSHLSVYHDSINPGLAVLCIGLVGLAPVYALLFESMFPRGRRAEGRNDGRGAS